MRAQRQPSIPLPAVPALVEESTPTSAAALERQPYGPDRMGRGQVVAGCLRRLAPGAIGRRPVALVLYLASLATTVLAVRAPAGFAIAVALGLWLTLAVGLAAETLAEGEGRPRAAALRQLRHPTLARLLWGADRQAATTPVASTDLAVGDLVLVEAEEEIPGDGEVVEGAGWVDESALTPAGEPVLRAAGGATGTGNAVVGGTRLLSDWLVVRITAAGGETFLDRTIARVEGAERRRTPAEAALAARTAGLTVGVLAATAALLAAALYSVRSTEQGSPLDAAALVALLACLAPTALGGLPPALGIAGRRRMREEGIAAVSDRAVAAAGELDVVLLRPVDLAGGLGGRLGELRRMGIHTVLATAADPLAAATAAAAAGADDFLAEATPERERELVLDLQAAGRLVAAAGGTACDAPVLAQADVAMAASSGTDAARQAANLIALAPAPAKLVEAAAIGRGLGAARRRLAVFATAGDVAKCFAILPVVLSSAWPALGRLDLLHLASPRSAILAAVVWNLLAAAALTPLAIHGRRAARPRRDAWVYALGGVAAALAGIKLVDLMIQGLGLGLVAR